jgi:iron-sulfur cluster assembly protein
MRVFNSSALGMLPLRVPTGPPIQLAKHMVTLTDIAAQKVQEFMTGQAAEAAEGDVGLRVGVKGGGCSGFQYALALDEKREDDHVFEISGIRVLVDPASMQYVDGSTVDFTETFMGSGFEVSNPNVVASCGCGSSFRVAEEEPSCGASV